MYELIVDTSALIAFFIRSEKNHQPAFEFMLQNKNMRWIILESVFDETVTWMRAKVSIKASIQIGHILREEHCYVNISKEDDLAVWDAFCKYDDKKWSYTDCSIFVMSRRLNVKNVFAFDEHIRQMAGLGVFSVP